jgi:hypothetical protein
VSAAYAQPPVPPGLQPGDHYHLIFATSFPTDIDTDTSVPPATPFFGGLAAADYTVTYAAWSGGMLPEWNFADITWHAVLSTNGHNAKDPANPPSARRSVHKAATVGRGDGAAPVKWRRFLRRGAHSATTGRGFVGTRPPVAVL